MNECFHAKCGERAREAPVCPACKHNNTDVSIHQVDPGKARRDLEKCLSRRHVDRIPLPNSLSLSLPPPIPFLFSFQPSSTTVFQTRFRSFSSRPSRFHHACFFLLRFLCETTSVSGFNERVLLQISEEMKAATKDTLDQWAGKSVWSLVCAMELGLISDTASRNNNEVSFRPISEIASKSPLRISPRLRTTPRFRKKRGGGRRKRRASKSGKMSGKRREMYANDSTITVDQFWKSCKRKPGRPKKCSADLLSSSIDRRPILADESCRSTRSRSANNNNNNNVLLANGTDAPRAFEPRRVSRDDNGAWKSSTKTVLHEKTNDENTIENVVTRSKREKGFESKDSKRDENRESTTRFDEIHTLPLMKRIFRESGAVYGVENEREDGRDTDVEKSTVYEAGKKDSVKKVSSYERKKIRAKMLKGNEENQEVRRVTRGSMKIGKDLSVGKLVWGYCAGWWPGKDFSRYTFLSNSPCTSFLFAFDR